MSRALAGACAILVLLFAAWASYIFIGLRSASNAAGVVPVSGISAPVTIVRDARDIAHIRASNDRDMMFGQGYAEGSDRLFQMDLLRRYTYGRLAEVLGPAALSADEKARVAPIAGIVQSQWEHLPARQRSLLQAFSDGVNAAMKRQPLPVEFRILLYKPQPWQPQDSLAAGMATALDLIDPWDDVIRRDAVARDRGAAPMQALYSITDPAYDAPIAPAIPAPVSQLPPRSGSQTAGIAQSFQTENEQAASNEWAAGAQKSRTGRALLANDPHLRLSIPGVWYLAELQSPTFHAAGASLTGTPGIILGHNDDIAWGATNGTVVTEVVYRDSLRGARERVERFGVRFGTPVRFTYYSTRHGFVAETRGANAFAVDWHAARMPRSPLAAFLGLDLAHSIAQALEALRTYAGPPQNFVLADRSGMVAYHLAGPIPQDPYWGLRVHAATDPPYGFIPFDSLPATKPARSSVVYTANNRMYGVGYERRLSPNFAPPYRAYRIERLLRMHRRYAIADFEAMQSDTFSIPERDIARDVLAAVKRERMQRDARLRPYLSALASWNGRFDPQSRGAPVAWEMRRIASASLAKYNTPGSTQAYEASAGDAEIVLLMRVLRERPRGYWPRSDYDALLTGALRTAVARNGSSMLESWSRYGRVTVKHALSSLGAWFLNGAQFPGDGDSFSLHVQTPSHSQSFRAVWDVGNWNAGGIVIPSGESGEPASGHYTDLSAAWTAQRLLPLPYGSAAVGAAAKSTLTLKPR